MVYEKGSGCLCGRQGGQAVGGRGGFARVRRYGLRARQRQGRKPQGEDGRKRSVRSDARGSHRVRRRHRRVRRLDARNASPAQDFLKTPVRRVERHEGAPARRGRGGQPVRQPRTHRAGQGFGELPRYVQAAGGYAGRGAGRLAQAQRRAVDVPLPRGRLRCGRRKNGRIPLGRRGVFRQR